MQFFKMIFTTLFSSVTLFSSPLVLLVTILTIVAAKTSKVRKTPAPAQAALDISFVFLNL